MKCSFCGLEFDEKDKNTTSCQGCPMSGHCSKICCPHCGFEMAKPVGLFKWLKSRRKRNDANV